MRKEISIDEILKKFCTLRCGTLYKVECYKNGSSPHCLPMRMFSKFFKNCTITRKANSELAEEKFQNGLKLADNGFGEMAIEDLIKAYELLKKGDE